MKYTAKYFKDSMPEWKRKKDPVITRIFYRPLSFVCAAFAANHKISANAVSYCSTIISITGCFLFLINNFAAHIVGACLFNFWLLFDCIDGNLARGIKKQPFGEFADAISSYILVGLMSTMMGFSIYFDGGLIIPAGTPWIILIGALASSADTLMRLIYQKYKSTEREMADQGIVEIENDIRKDNTQVGSLRVRIESELGVGGIIPLMILLATIFNALDLAVIYCFCYYGVSCLVSSLTYVRKAVVASKKAG